MNNQNEVRPVSKKTVVMDKVSRDRLDIEWRMRNKVAMKYRSGNRIALALRQRIERMRRISFLEKMIQQQYLLLQQNQLILHEMQVRRARSLQMTSMDTNKSEPAPDTESTANSAPTN